MFVLKKFLFVLVFLGCVSKLMCAPVQDRKASEADAADPGDKKTAPLDPKVARHLLAVFGLIAVVVLSIVKILRVLCEKYSDWKDRKDSLKRQRVDLEDPKIFVTKKYFEQKKGKKVFTPPRNIFDDV